ncbi:DUF922 domain-containing Zn-dependent protease [Frigidibacter sp. ROC022]|uniref:DUF922 domain-containing Zn-dependent protease n=1 Tax=Frigidibacter sp. ROC022 TaxID=2971796 RepID=UPI00215ACFE3|nr:DUF922 domain-containing Zn-dependent protease [Frigidibacter sp. ROC022]MCR8726291.1 DUF922 domain-containing Zn-dependent protease [Frigidibacter sp. ROC022]
MPTKIINGGNKFKHIDLKGETLEAIDKQRRKSGCKDPNSPGKRFYGLTEATIALTPGEIIPIFQSMMGLGAQVTVKFKDVEAKYSAVTTLCRPANKAKLTPKAKAEWERFEKELIKHEKLHFDDAKALADTVATEVHKMSVTGKGKTLEEAGVNAAKALKFEYSKTFTGKKLVDRINKGMAKRDSIDGHGTGSGAKLKYAIK